MVTKKKYFYQNMEHKSDNVSQFYVVHFIEKPFKRIDYYVCVPYTWVILHKREENVLVVAYPKNEDPSVTRERVLKKEKHQGTESGWQFCTANLKFQSDTYKDAERWISDENNRRSSVPDVSAKKMLPWDHELRRGGQKYPLVYKDNSEKAVTPYQIPRKQFPNAKQKKQLYLKRLNLERTETVKSTVQNTTTVKSTVQNTTREPVSSTIDQSITIGDKQPIENAATNDAPKTEDSTHSRTNSKPSEQELIINVDAHTEVNVNRRMYQSQQEHHRETRNQIQLAVSKSPSAVEQNRHDHPKLRIKNIQHRTAPSKNVGRVVIVSNERSFTIHDLSNSSTRSDELSDQTLNSRRNMPSKWQNDLIKVDPTKSLPQPLTKSSTANIQKARQETSLLITNNVNSSTAASMAFSSQDIQHVAAMIPASSTPKNITSVTSPENYAVTHQQFSFIPQILQQNLLYPQEHKQTQGQDLAQRHTAHRFAPRRLKNHPTDVIRHQPIRPPVNSDPTNIPSQFYQPLDNQPRVQRVVTHQDAQQLPVSTSTLQRNNRRSLTLQGVQKTTPPPALPKVPKSVAQILVNVLENYRMDEQELQVLFNAIMKQQTASGVINGLPNTTEQQNHSPRSPESIGSSYQSSKIETPPVHRNYAANNIERFEYNPVDRSQNSSSKIESQQLIMERFYTLCMTLNSSFTCAANMLDNLRDSFRKISVSNAPSYSNVIQEAPPVVEEKQILAAEKRNSSNSNQQNDSVNNAPKKTHMKNSREDPHSRRWFVLPSEYHPNSTKWTLKYEKGMPGVVELMPNSKIYVRFNKRERFEQGSTSCESLAQLMLHEVFNEKALGVCASMREMAKTHYQQSPYARPPLDNHGSLVLLNYVIEYGIKCGWNVNEKKIFEYEYIDHDIKEMRFKYSLTDGFNNTVVARLRNYFDF